MRALQVDENVSLNEVINLRPTPDGTTRYRVGEKALIKIAEEIGAVVYVGSRRLINREKMDKYFYDKAE